MEKRKLGHSDLLVSVIGLGCMSLGTDEKKAQQIIEVALDSGINYFDTADLYDAGNNEKIIGQALKHVRSDVIIATKVGNRWKEDHSGWYWDPSKTYIKEAVKQSLKRLGTDYIDLYQLHGGTIEDRIEETIEAFEELKDEGVIRYYGISSIRPNVIKSYAEKSNMVSVMMQYSLLDRRPEEQAISILQEHGISVVARGPLAKGLLSERFMNKISEKGYLDYSSEELRVLLPNIKEQFAQNRSMNALSLQFVLANPTVASCVAGASSVPQLQENIRAISEPPLSHEEMELLKQLTKSNGYSEHRI